MSKYSAADFAQAGFKYIGRSYDEMDCQKFFEKCMDDVGLKMDLTGSNAWYREFMKKGWVGTPEECKKKFGSIPKGATIFILEPVSDSTPAKYRDDGIGDATHIGIKTGRGQGAIHSSHSRGGVCESKFQDKTIPNGGWNQVGLYNKFTYGSVIDAILDGGGVDPEPGPGPEPEPTPEPQREIARVDVPNKTNVITRKGPDSKKYGMSKAGRIPQDSLVEILRRETNDKGEEWCYISWQDQKKAVWYCWVKGEFLVPVEDPTPSTDLYVVHIPYLTKYKAQALVAAYPGAWMTEGEEGGDDDAVG